MRYATVCSGIEACSAAWEPLGWKPVFFSEIEKYQSAVLAHHYPHVPNLGDMTAIDGTEYNGTIDILCGGTPCQSFSVAGLRAGLTDQRGNLALEFFRLVDQIRPKWVIWENVPGVLSSNRGRDFGSILGALGELGYGFAYRILDAQYFGVPQRRRRVFVVGHIGGSFAPAASVLFEPESVCGDTPARRKERQRFAAYTKSGFGNWREGCRTLRADGGDLGGGSETLAVQWPADVAPTLDANFGRLQGSDNQSVNAGCGLYVPMVFNPNAGTTNGGQPSTESCHTLDASHVPAIQTGVQVRRLTPMECERLQGFPDNYTAIRGDKTPDTPRYQSLGNSMAVPVMRWLGERIQKVDKILQKK